MTSLLPPSKQIPLTKLKRSIMFNVYQIMSPRLLTTIVICIHSDTCYRVREINMMPLICLSPESGKNLLGDQSTNEFIRLVHSRTHSLTFDSSLKHHPLHHRGSQYSRTLEREREREKVSKESEMTSGQYTRHRVCLFITGKHLYKTQRE